ncbi:MAG: hypothetical protein AAFU64_06120, partial [Bacteroidota bacterium]
MQKKKGDFYFLSVIWLIGSIFFSLQTGYGQSSAILRLSSGTSLELSQDFYIAPISPDILPDLSNIHFIPLRNFDQDFQSHQDYLLRFSLSNLSSEEVNAFIFLGNWSYLDIFTREDKSPNSLKNIA